MNTLATHSHNDTLFWIIWGIEAIFMLWWLLDDLKLKHHAVNPNIYLGWLWILLTLGLFWANWRVPAFIMAGIAAIPLALMGVYLLIILIASLFGPIRWN